MLRPKIGLDWDDVTAPFNSIAIAMANEKYHIDPPLRLEEIDTWENRGRTGIIREFYEDEELYARQQVPEKNKKAVYRLMEIADVYFITAVAPAFMGIRAETDSYSISGIPAGEYYSGAMPSAVLAIRPSGVFSL